VNRSVDTRAPQAQASVVVLHRALGIGLVVTGIALIAVRRTAGGDTTDDGTLFEYLFSAVSVIMAGVALLVLRPQVPRRRAGQTVSQYWGDAQITGRTHLFWFILEGAGIIAAVGHFLSGGPITGVVWALVAAAFWMNGPSVFEHE
jgi:hypothetical protein